MVLYGNIPRTAEYGFEVRVIASVDCMGARVYPG